MSKKILVVEDEIGTQKAVKKALEKAGFITLVANNGEEGLKIVNEEIPDLIIADIIMPVMDGFQFYKGLKTSKALKDIPVIILTVKNKMEDTFMVMGVDCFLTKPFQPEDLLFHIDQLLNKDEVRYLKDKKILVAGSIDSIMHEMITQFRMVESGETNMAKDTKDLMAKVEQFDPDFLMVELEMEGTNMSELADQIHGIKKFSGKPIVVYEYRPDGASDESVAGKLLSTNEGGENKNFNFMGKFKEETFIKNVIKSLSASR